MMAGRRDATALLHSTNTSPMSMPMNSDELFRLVDQHVDALYINDDQRRITACRNSPHAPIPRVHLVRTAAGNRWWLGARLAPALVDPLERLLSAEPTVADLEALPPHIDEVEALLATDTPSTHSYRGPAFVFPAAIAPASDVVLVEQAEPDPRFIEPFAWVRDCQQSDHPIAVRFVDGVAAAVCHSARDGASAYEAGVDTAEPYRNQGHASAVVAEWARAVRARDRIPMYSTDWTNTASRGVARRLGLVIYAEDWNLR